MPELPEVETIRRSLEPKLLGREIIGVRALVPGMLQNTTLAELKSQIVGCRIIAIERRGKYLLLRLDRGLTLAVHLRMTGQLLVKSVEIPAVSSTYFFLDLDNQCEFRFADVRKFGKIILYPTAQIPLCLNKLGPEPLSDDFTAANFIEIMQNRKVAVKKALLNQELIAGIGNIYADEALFLAQIHPLTLVSNLTSAELKNLHKAIRQVLNEGIEHRGTSVRDYRDGEGARGTHQQYLRVYGRRGEPCKKCQTSLEKITVGGRGTHFCPKCQVQR